MALPVKKKRILPSWMKGAAKRTGLGLSGTKTTHGAKPEASRAQVSKTPNKTRPVQPMSKAKCKTISAGFWHHFLWNFIVVLSNLHLSTEECVTLRTIIISCVVNGF